MNCPSCRSTLPEGARFCPSCGSNAHSSLVQTAQGISSSEGQLSAQAAAEGSRARPEPTVEFRDKLLESYLSFSISKELSELLGDLGEQPSGTIEDKLARIQRHGKSLALPSEPSPRQTLVHLSHYDAEVLAEICQELGLPSEGSKEILFRRIYGEVGRREGWLRPTPEDARVMIKETLLPILKSFDYEKDYYMAFWEDLSDLFSEENVHMQLPLAHGSAFIAVMIPDLFQESRAALLQEELKARGLELS